MGSNSSKTSKIDRRERNELRETKINDNINNIKHFEQKIIQSARANTTEIVNYDELKTYLDITSNATEQLMRDGKPLTKKDLIAIIIALHPEQMANIKSLDTLTVTDLISMIRCTIYDMNRYMNNARANHAQTTDLETIRKPRIEDKKNTKAKQLCIADSTEKSNQLVITQTFI